MKNTQGTVNQSISHIRITLTYGMKFSTCASKIKLKNKALKMKLINHYKQERVSKARERALQGGKKSN